MDSKEKIIISQPWGGLGDNLAFSTLPQLYSELGHEVYISSKNAARNQEIFDLVWGRNPYIKGISDLPPNAGDCKGYECFTANCVKNLELSHGLSNGNNKYPIIYYTPKLIKDLNNVLLFDLTSVNWNAPDDVIKKYYNDIFEMYPEVIKKKIVFKNYKNRELELKYDDDYVINNIYEYCDALYSCKVFVSLLTGCAALACTVKQDNSSPEIYTIHRSQYFKKAGEFYCFDNAKYISVE